MIKKAERNATLAAAEKYAAEEMLVLNLSDDLVRSYIQVAFVEGVRYGVERSKQIFNESFQEVRNANSK